MAKRPASSEQPASRGGARGRRAPEPEPDGLTFVEYLTDLHQAFASGSLEDGARINGFLLAVGFGLHRPDALRLQHDLAAEALPVGSWLLDALYALGPEVRLGLAQAVRVALQDGTAAALDAVLVDKPLPVLSADQARGLAVWVVDAELAQLPAVPLARRAQAIAAVQGGLLLQTMPQAPSAAPPAAPALLA